MQFYWLILGSLCVWRLTHLLHAEAGPGEILSKIRRRLAGGFAGSLTGCFYCLSLWVSAPVAAVIGSGYLERAALWPALSAGAILFERVSSWALPAPTVYYEHGSEEPNALLRET